MKKRNKANRKLPSGVKFCILLSIFTAAVCFSILSIMNWGETTIIARDELSNSFPSVDIKENRFSGRLQNPVEEESLNLNGDTPTVNQIMNYQEFANLPFYEVDFEQLTSENSDTVAYIHMNSLDISYPILQKKDDDVDHPYYATHDFNGNENSKGWVFANKYSSFNPIGYTPVPYGTNTPIYGHANGKNSVFYPFQDMFLSSWQSNLTNYAVWISTPQRNYVFQIFSVYTVYPETYYEAHSYSDPKVKEDWYKTMKNRSVLSYDVFVNTDDIVITLASIPGDFTHVIVAQAKLIKWQDRVQDVNPLDDNSSSDESGNTDNSDNTNQERIDTKNTTIQNANSEPNEETASV